MLLNWQEHTFLDGFSDNREQSIVIDDEIDCNPGRVLKNIDYRLAIYYQIQLIIDPLISNQLSIRWSID